MSGFWRPPIVGPLLEKEASPLSMSVAPTAMTPAKESAGELAGNKNGILKNVHGSKFVN
jgi:hypothetical protein